LNVTLHLLHFVSICKLAQWHVEMLVYFKHISHFWTRNWLVTTSLWCREPHF